MWFPARYLGVDMEVGDGKRRCGSDLCNAVPQRGQVQDVKKAGRWWMKAGKARLHAPGCTGCATHVHGIVCTCEGCVGDRSFQHILWIPLPPFFFPLKFPGSSVRT